MTNINIGREWQTGTLASSRMIADDVKSLVFTLPEWLEPKAGQYYDIRLTAENGYQAVRSYSLASPPEDNGVAEFGIQKLPGGEVSTYLYDMNPGDQVELKGPLGGHFIWDADMVGPLILVGGGSGMVPLMSMLRHHLHHLGSDRERKVIFMVSAPNEGHVLYRDELEEVSRKDPNFRLVITLTREQPEGWTGYRRRIDTEMIKDVLGGFQPEMPMAYICGPTPFVETVAGKMVEAGFNSHQVRTERFGGLPENKS